MSEYVFRDASGYGCDMSDLMDGGRVTVGEYFASENTDHYGTLHEEIVRCRDCRHFNIGPNTDCCGFTDKYAHPNGFCSWGESKEVDE